MLTPRVGARVFNARNGLRIMSRVIVGPGARTRALAEHRPPIPPTGLLACNRFFSHQTRRSEPPTTPCKHETAPGPASLHEDIYTLPNLLTLSRLVAAPFIGYFVLHEQHALALGLFVYAGISDLADGYIARRWNKQTVVGTVIDPMADKALMTILTVCLAVKGALPGVYETTEPLPTLLTVSMGSLAGGNHPRPRRWSGHGRLVLSVDIAPAASNCCSLLGLFLALGRGATNHHQQVQHGPATGAGRPRDGCPRLSWPSHPVSPGPAVSCFRAGVATPGFSHLLTFVLLVHAHQVRGRRHDCLERCQLRLQ
jgi:hypothetical protein